MADRPSLRRADVLVVVAVVLLGGGLLVTGIVRAWRGSFRNGCQDNLRRIGLALTSYQQRMGTFPPGYISNIAADGTDLGPGWGWASFLLDDLNQSALRSQIQRKKDVQDSRHRPVTTTSLPGFICPSDRDQGVFTVRDAKNRSLADLAHASYIAVNGNQSVSTHPGKNDGVFLRNKAFRPSDIPDGLEYTLFISERSSEHSLPTWVGVVANGLVPARDGGYPELAPALVLGHAGIHRPNHPTNHDVDCFASRHPDGVNFLFGDGHVRLLKPTIPLHIYDALASRKGRESISLDDL